MRRIVLSILLTSFIISAHAQEPVVSHARIHKTTDWYKEQAAAWKKEIDKNPQNSLAWYYYYYANRNLNAKDTTDTRTHKQKVEFMDKLVEDMGKAVPESYEYNFVKWQWGGRQSEWHLLEKAEKLGPDRTEHLDGMINWGELSRDIAKRNKYSLKKYEAGQISPGMMNYNYNAIIGLEPNAILVTAGDNDTYPIWVLQAQNIRKDITVLNLSLMMIDDYRDRIFKELGLKKWESLWNEPEAQDAKLKRYYEGIVEYLTTNSKNFPVYVGLTAAGHAPYMNAVEDHLYLTGLAYIYSKEPVDNMALLRKNFEQLYALDYLENTFYEDISKHIVTQCNRNYIVPMLKLYDHYKSAGEVQKEAWIKRKLMAVSSGTADEENVKNHLQ